MKCLNVILVSMILATAYYANAKPQPMIGIDIPIPVPSGIGPIPRGIPSEFPVETGTAKVDTSKEVETMEKSESAFYGYYPYYYGWPNYGGYRYPLVYVGK